MERSLSGGLYGRDGRKERLAHCRHCGGEFWKRAVPVGVPSAYCSVRCRQQAANARKREKRRAAAMAAASAAAGAPP